MVGCSTSLTVTLNPAVVVLLSCRVPVTTTGVVPTTKNEPEGGALVTTPQLPVIVGAKLTTAPHRPGSFACVMSVTPSVQGEKAQNGSAVAMERLHPPVMVPTSAPASSTT